MLKKYPSPKSTSQYDSGQIPLIYKEFFNTNLWKLAEEICSLPLTSPILSPRRAAPEPHAQFSSEMPRDMSLPHQRQLLATAGRCDRHCSLGFSCAITLPVSSVCLHLTFQQKHGALLTTLPKATPQLPYCGCSTLQHLRIPHGVPFQVHLEASFLHPWCTISAGGGFRHLRSISNYNIQFSAASH